MMTNRSTAPSFGGAIRGFFATLLAAVLAIVGFVFMLVVMAVGLIAGTLLVSWALLRGRRPQGIRFGVPPGARFRPGAPWQRAPRGEVIDVETREVKPDEPGAR